jgi:hypothetical protein
MKRQLLNGLLMVVFSMSALAEPAQWQTAASAEYKLLWKRLTYTELQIKSDQLDTVPDNILSTDYAKRIVIQYGVGVSAERFRDMTRDSLDDAFSKQELAPYNRQIEEFCGWFDAVEKDDRYSLTWEPNRGLTLARNASPVGVVKDADAAAIILSVWLGRAAISESQRDDMLAQWRQFTQSHQVSASKLLR